MNFFKRAFSLADNSETEINDQLPRYPGDVCELAVRVYHGYQLVGSMQYGDAIISGDNGSFCVSTSESRSFATIRREFERLTSHFNGYATAEVKLYAYLKQERGHNGDDYRAFASVDELELAIGSTAQWPHRIETLGFFVR